MSLLRHGQLSEYFERIGYKRLSDHEVDPRVSNGHEFQGVSQLRAMLGTEDCDLTGEIVYLSNDLEAPLRQTGALKWYDARRKNPNRRAEYRLYYSADLGLVQAHARAEDLFIIATPSPDHPRPTDIVVVIAERGSTYETQLLWLFGVADVQERFQSTEVRSTQDRELSLAARHILEAIGVEVRDVTESLIAELIEKFGERFPKTAEMSSYAARLFPEALLRDDPDAALVSLMDTEETMFRALERHHVSHRLAEGFAGDVEGFIEYSLSVQNRRKSRVGHALEHHLARIFEANDVAFTRGGVTEHHSKPDFVFPGISEYRNPAFPSARLTMLGAKSTCKDRWRQVLAEAKRIDEKHLLTLEPAISERQTAEMAASRLQLVVPAEIRRSYTAEQQSWVMSLKEFRDVVARRARR